MSMIKIHSGNIWDEDPIDGYVVVPTNIGWKSNGEAVMGTGLAKLAAERFPELLKEYGRWCKENGNNIYVNDRLRVICAPIKVLNEDQPHLSWQRPADKKLVMCSYIKIHRLVTDWRDRNNLKCPVLGMGRKDIKREEAIELATQFDWPKCIKFFDEYK